MDTSHALDHYPERRDLLNGFLLEYSLLTTESPELTELLSFEAYAQFCFSFFALRQQRSQQAGISQQLKLLREHLPLPVPATLLTL
ncbi:hypothetical protein HHL22_03980 [Hymenobacter sp. RP-2-7]|uniref:Uncharacterized protein n=1 Tax=Hymenobacter polaris TaxID=2682546 RepID=A0A7Y0ABN3_9BACT|nr:hypothetical protein [Hymenobacter polaris]NML64357.1 hypothetical protein [Hymenobacter polaris]